MKMMEYKTEIVSVENWIEAFNHVGSMIVRNDSKAAFWTQPNSNSLNSQSDRSHRDTDWQKNKKTRVDRSWNDSYYEQTSWNSNSRDNSSRNQGSNSNMGNQNPPDSSAETVKPPGPISKMELQDLCPHCGWRVEHTPTVVDITGIWTIIRIAMSRIGLRPRPLSY